MESEGSNIEIDYFESVLFDEISARLDVVSHEDGKYLVRTALRMGVAIGNRQSRVEVPGGMVKINDLFSVR